MSCLQAQGDLGVREKLQGGGGFDAAMATTKKAGFDVSKAEWPRDQAEKVVGLNDEVLKGVARGKPTGYCDGKTCKSTAWNNRCQ